ncbi:MAG: glycosyl transferase, partial [Chloroflexi bacterium]|nr:glycosyl transferase [Chloroflexota bacterium]
MSDNKKYSVLQVLPHLNSGGLVSGAIEVSSALVQNNFRSIVVSQGGRREREIERYGGNLIHMNVASKNPYIMYRNIFSLFKIIKKNNIDIIHARSRAPAWSVYYAAKKASIPFITTFHGTYGFNNKIK